ncbi:MAG: hypothetical protein WBG17_14550 [Burkholderiaceae bacterium]
MVVMTGMAVFLDELKLGSGRHYAMAGSVRGIRDDEIIDLDKGKIFANYCFDFSHCDIKSVLHCTISP